MKVCFWMLETTSVYLRLVWVFWRSLAFSIQDHKTRSGNLLEYFEMAKVSFQLFVFEIMIINQESYSHWFVCLLTWCILTLAEAAWTRCACLIKIRKAPRQTLANKRAFRLDGRPFNRCRWQLGRRRVICCCSDFEVILMVFWCRILDAILANTDWLLCSLFWLCILLLLGALLLLLRLLGLRL